ncbi:hypothetical protein LPJ59_004295 [Coemansia sp. RSA 2399]|nr:hypothetical protein LPJ59_004295 [Coemansia sp. RSA 2399]
MDEPAVLVECPGANEQTDAEQPAESTSANEQCVTEDSTSSAEISRATTPVQENPAVAENTLTDAGPSGKPSVLIEPEPKTGPFNSSSLFPRTIAYNSPFMNELVFGELPEWAQRNGLCIIAIATNNTPLKSSRGAIMTMLKLTLPPTIQIHNVSEVTRAAYEILLDAGRCYEACHILLRRQWKIILAETPNYTVTSMGSSSKSDIKLTLARWKREIERTKSYVVKQYYGDLVNEHREANWLRPSLHL